MRSAISSVRRHIIALLCLMFAFSTAAIADTAAIREKGFLVCGVLGTDPPFSFKSDAPSADLVGYDVDLCKSMAQRLDVRVVLKALVVAERLPALLDGRVDILAASLTRTHERAALIDFSIPTFVTGGKVMVRRDAGIARLADLREKTVLTINGSTMQENLKIAVPSAKVQLFDGGQQAFAAFRSGNGVAYANDETTLLENLDQLGPDAAGYQILPQRLTTEFLAIGVRKTDSALLAHVNKTLLELEASGDAEKLFMRWFGPDTRMKFDKRGFTLRSRP